MSGFLFVDEIFVDFIQLDDALQQGIKTSRTRALGKPVIHRPGQKGGRAPLQ